MATRAARIAAQATARAAHIQPRRPPSARQINRASQTSRAEAARSLETQAGVAWLINWCAQVELDLRRQRLTERLTTALSPVGATHGATHGAAYGA